MIFGNEILQIPRFIYEDILTKMHIYVYVMMERFDNPRKYKKDSGSSYRGIIPRWDVPITRIFRIKNWMIVSHWKENEVFIE